MSGDFSEQAEWIEGDQHRERDYDSFSHVLDVVRGCFSTLHMGFAEEERWRWDTPVISLSWSNGQDHISRNLQGLVLGELRPTGVQIEANAWYDVREKGALVRHWQNLPAGRVDSIDKEGISSLITKAYNMVAECSKQQIENETKLPNG